MHRMKYGKIAAFPALNAFVKEEEFNMRSICQIFLEHLSLFLSKLYLYIPSHDYKRTFNWVPCPFETSALQVYPKAAQLAEWWERPPRERLGFDSESGQTNDFKIGIHSFPV